MPRITDIIKYEGDNSTLIWKHPCEDFNSLTQLIVHESQEAIFFMNGQALDLFGPGCYTLETQNLPLVSKALRLVTGGVSPFHCEVYFINKIEQTAIKWGTDSKVEYMDPTYGFPIAVGASGQLSLRVADSRKLLLKLVGTEQVLTKQALTDFCKGLMMTKIKSYIASVMRSGRIPLFEIDEHLDEFSQTIRGLLAQDLEEYGIVLERFFVTTVVRPDGDPQYERFKELHFRRYADVAEAKLRQEVSVIDAETEAQKIVIESQAKAVKRRQEGYTYSEQRRFDVAEKAAANEGAGQWTGLGIGLGAMAGVADTVGTAVRDALLPNEGCLCDNCGKALEKGSVFCDGCGRAVAEEERCAHCGFVFARPGNFCPKCGTKR